MSYGLQVASKKAYSIDQVMNAANEASKELQPAPDCVVLHTGVNDLKGKDPIACSKKMAAAVENIQMTFPHSHIVISKVIPAKPKTFEGKRAVFNAHAFSEIVEKNDRNITFVSHENIRTWKHLQDDIHPNDHGASVMARNLGQHLHRLFWEQPRRKRQRAGFNANISRQPPPHRNGLFFENTRRPGWHATCTKTQA